MAGESRRFHDAGHKQPKFMLPLASGFVFDHAVRSFSRYFSDDAFLFVLRDDAIAKEFVAARCKALGVGGAACIFLNQATSGQAETVLLGLDRAGIGAEKQISIFNIDTFRPGYRKPDFLDVCDGYLEVFKGSGANWSFVAANPRNSQRVAATAEKRAISDLCCTGLYYFRKAEDFRWAYAHPVPPENDAERKERYVAPLYNALIRIGRNIRYEIVASSDVIFSGTPDEYTQICASGEILARLERNA
jgi:hypothetical protein